MQGLWEFSHRGDSGCGGDFGGPGRSWGGVVGLGKMSRERPGLVVGDGA